MVELGPLKRLTKELAEEIEYDEIGPIFKLFKLLFDNINTLTVIIDKDNIIKYMNPVLTKYLEENNLDGCIGDNWYKTIWKMGLEPDEHPARIALEQRKVVHKNFSSPMTGRKFIVTAIPLIYNGVSGTICFAVLCDDA